MKTRINLFILILLASSAFFAEAKEVEQTKAYQLATRFASGLDSTKLRSNALLQLAYTATAPDNSLMRTVAGRPLFYIYNVAGNGGFVIVSADDAASPVLGYAGQGEFTAQSMPSNLRKWLGHYEKEISFAINQGYAATEEIKQEWDALANGTLNAGNPVVLIKTVDWGQSAPYNNQCPMDGRSRSVAGCVATAMSTLMKHHRWPVKGTGSISYATRSKGIPVSANFNVAYDWNNMLDTYARNNWTQAQGNAVATLVFHSGVAALMDYESNESGAWSSDAVDAFINHFGYDKGTYLAYRDLYTTGEWDALLQNELKANRPLLYGGVTKEVEGEDQSGHQFIIDGYAPGENASSCYYHVNWGWNGAINGYFLLDALDPKGGGKPGEGFSYDQDVALGLQKAREGSSTNNEMFFIESKDYEVAGLQVEADSIVVGQPFLLATSYIYDYSERDFEGEWGLFVVDKQGKRKFELDVIRYALPKKLALHNSPEEYIIMSNVEEGDRLRMYYRPDGHDWKPVRGLPGAVLEIPIGVKFTNVSNVTVAPQESSVIVSLQPGGNIQVRSPKNEAIRETWLYNLFGQLIRHDTFTSTHWQATIPATQLSPGIYILKVSATSGSYTRKLINN